MVGSPLLPRRLRGCRRGVLAGMMGPAAVLFLSFLPPGVQSSGRPSGHFLYQAKAECHFPRGAPDRVRFLDRYFYDRQEIVRYDSAVGRYVAVTPLGEPDASYWNGQKAILDQRRAEVDRFCRNNYGILEPFSLRRKVQPAVAITPTKDSAASTSGNILLICDVAGFWPAGINITWFRNGKEEKGPTVMTTDLIRNGDWTFQIQVMLETKPERGDVYACQVEHPSFDSPVRVQWEPQSDSARSKMWTGIAGLILGLVLLAPGLILFFRNKKGAVLPQPPVPLMS